MLGLDNIIDAQSEEFDEFINDIKHTLLSEAGKVDIITSSYIVKNKK